MKWHWTNYRCSQTPRLAPRPTPDAAGTAQQLDEQASLATDGIIEIMAAELKFAPNRWRMTLGDTVTIRIANADSQRHNLRLAGLDGEYETDDDALTLPDAIAPVRWVISLSSPRSLEITPSAATFIPVAWRPHRG
jgi:hypothetical protein